MRSVVASIIYPVENLASNYLGLASIFEYTNWDGTQTRFNCGQAAACTYLTHLGKLEPATKVMQAIEAAHPPEAPAPAE